MCTSLQGFDSNKLLRRFFFVKISCKNVSKKRKGQNFASCSATQSQIYWLCSDVLIGPLHSPVLRQFLTLQWDSCTIISSARRPSHPSNPCHNLLQWLSKTWASFVAVPSVRSNTLKVNQQFCRHSNWIRTRMANLDSQTKIPNAFASVATQDRSSCWTAMIVTAGSMVCVCRNCVSSA